ncbi:MAG: hypothetical protein A2511_13815 [Deltaproteobacteria bacterium RIFOXYD12_FULL_50_9]|nr:MAG: hypothetical protein A2511_13815 [Deltaproteobacteria bacterium RIFOXYD12_FULL_50_9]
MSKKSRKDPLSYCKRTYRQWIDPTGLLGFEVKIRETDLHIQAPRDIAELSSLSAHTKLMPLRYMQGLARHLVIQYRSHLEGYIASHPKFLTSFAPLPADPLAPSLVKEMLKAGQTAGVGPMAAVAGAIAEFVGRDLLAAGAAEIIVENGGDIFLSRVNPCTISIFAGSSPLSDCLGVRLAAGAQGVCTSSGTVGHSISFGRADAVTVVARSTALADAAATRLGNAVKVEADIAGALELAKAIPGLNGAVIVMGSRFGAWGDVELVRLD